MSGATALLAGKGSDAAQKQGYSTFDGESPSRLVLPKVENVSWLSRFTYTHARPLLDEGSQRRLELEDLWDLEAPYHAQAAYAPFKRAYVVRNNSLTKALLATVGGKFFLCGLGAGVRAACALFAPIVLRQVIDAFSAETLDLMLVYWWVGAFFVSRIVNAFLEAHVNFLMEMTLLKMTVSLKALVFEKLMRRSLQSTGETNKVNVSNVVTADIDNLMWSGYSLNSVWIMPIQVGVVIYLLYDVLELAAFAGLGVVVLSIMLNNAVATQSKRSFDQVMKLKDKRMGVVKEVFTAIQIIKLNAWEDRFLEKINQWRSLELRAVTKYLYVVAMSVFLLWSTPLVVSVVSFATYALVLGKQLTAAKVFTSMVLFNAIRDPLSQFPGALQTILQARTALERIASFLKTDEVESERRLAKEAAKHGKSIEIAMDKASFSWSKKTTTTTTTTERRTVLQDISLTVRKGDFVVIHGAVGSGKSSLLAALLGELPAENGSVFVRSSSVAFYSQQPWIQNTTIRDNILFGKPYNKVKFDKVIDACGLTKDISMLPAGDNTEIGQKGVNLSGGQKARISLARACYSDADVLILDSPLAAVDAVVQKEIFNKCLCGLLEKKTVVLTTHIQEIVESKAVTVKVQVENGRAKVTHFDRKKARHQYAKLKTDTSIEEKDVINTDKPKHSVDGTLIEKEGRQGGLVSGRVFKSYALAMGGTRMLIGFVLILAAWQSFQIGSDFWLSHWTGPRDAAKVEEVEEDTLEAVKYNLSVYALLGLGASVFVLLRALTVAFVGVSAAKQLFDGMTKSLLHAPLRFFDANPIGRIINRYSEDVSMIDFRLPPVFFGAFVASVMVAFQLLAALVVIQWAGVLVLPLCWVYVRLGGFYFAANLEVSRLRKVTTSPVLSHIAESEDGVATLRAFGSDYVGRALQQHFVRVDENSRAWYAQTVISQWFALRVQLIGVGVVVIVVSSLLAFHELLSPGLIGVAFMYAMNVDQQLALGLKSWLWLEMYLVSPERVLEYVDLPTEGHVNDKLVVFSANRQPWPQTGTITFDNVKFAYKPGGDLVLKGLSFEVKHNEKIGIVGRTGAGKSSLALALFRVNELESGRIIVDGVDISTVHLRTLRSRMAIIPQAPVLFQGSMRVYMDPFDEYSDGEIWSAFEKVGIKELVSSLEGKLLHQLSENGENFSVGERQLLCLARALLCRSRVIVMDEATSAIDRGTEKKLQEMIKREFKNATVLTIAHRLSTVLESDRIMVVSGGRVVEFGTAEALAGVQRGVFRALAEESGHLQQLIKQEEQPERATQ